MGPSGAGKSTLINLLLRFWDDYAGRIEVGGCDLREYDPADVRRLFGVVSQSTYLFNTTVRQNLLLARPGATEEQLVCATRQAQVHQFICSLPSGYDTLIGEQGLSLSGGERQRLALARALLQEAPVLLLDEPAANLDPVTEREVLNALRDAMEDRSTLMLTHRLAGLAEMDAVLVLRAGRVVERGSHAELLQMDGMYRRMWELERSRIPPLDVAALPMPRQKAGA